MTCLYCDKKVNAKGLCSKHYWRWLNRKPMDDPYHSRRHVPTMNVAVNYHGYQRISLGNGKRVLLHRWLMEQFLGRELLSTEIVHHKNGDKLDNSIGNLEVTDRVSHMKYHPREFDECPTCGSKMFRKIDAHQTKIM